MNPQYAAQSLSQFGRGGDTTLMHVQPKEMAGIATLLGRPLTQNPNTGLPEAFNLSNLLPMIAGLGATVLTGGMAAPLVSPAIAGALASGATKTAMTGDLSQGIMTGLTSYATGSLLGDIGAANSLSAGAGGAAQGALPGVVDPAAAAAAMPGADAAAAAMPAVDAASLPLPMPPPPTPPVPPDLQAAKLAEAPMNPADIRTAKLGAARQQFDALPFQERLSNIGQGLTNTDVLMPVLRESPMRALGAVGGTLMSLGGSSQPNDPRRKQSTGGYSPIRPTNGWVPPPVGYNQVPGNGFISRFAEGGVASLEGGENMQSLSAARNLANEATAALLGEHPRPQEALRRFVDTFGPAMLEALRQQVSGQQSGGKVEGAGGGLDDLVPGSIEGRQDVRLADGEFVVPSDVVSALGDGSTDHGSRRLHEMMDRVRREKTGDTRQPGPINDREVMPA
jgi:hypothetical protein